jgi:predicted nucleotidyltransferase|tara:strand:+ start:143 stop:460 length:318 start_codon:yes stop_codon:yes gene_type:complete
VKSGQVKVNEKVESIVLKIQSIVADQVEGDYKLFLFGSRANGKSMERSDIDIAIMTNKKMDASILAKMREEIENISTLLTIDFVDLSRVDDDFRNHVLETGSRLD